MNREDKELLMHVNQTSMPQEKQPFLLLPIGNRRVQLPPLSWQLMKERNDSKCHFALKTTHCTGPLKIVFLFFPSCD